MNQRLHQSGACVCLPLLVVCGSCYCRAAHKKWAGRTPCPPPSEECPMLPPTPRFLVVTPSTLCSPKKSAAQGHSRSA